MPLLKPRLCIFKLAKSALHAEHDGEQGRHESVAELVLVIADDAWELVLVVVDDAWELLGLEVTLCHVFDTAWELFGLKGGGELLSSPRSLKFGLLPGGITPPAPGGQIGGMQGGGGGPIPSGSPCFLVVTLESGQRLSFVNLRLGRYCRKCSI